MGSPITISQLSNFSFNVKKKYVKMKKENKLKQMGPAIKFKRGVGAVSSSEDPAWIERESEFAMHGNCKLQKSTAYFCNVMLKIPRPGDTESNITNLLNMTCANDSQRRWNTIATNENINSNSNEMYENWEIYGIQNAFLMSKLHRP